MNRMDTNRRRPIRNFIILKEEQVPFIITVLLIVAITTLLTTAVILGVYALYSKSGYLYFMSNDFEKPLARRSVLSIALPGLLAAEAITLLIGFVIALFGSRRVSVPLFKLKRWAQVLSDGNLNVNLAFREKKQYRNIVNLCNNAILRMRNAFNEIDTVLNYEKVLKPDASREDLAETLEKARKTLKELKFKTTEHSNI
jgi:methyl-accepting chemotaxis protein